MGLIAKKILITGASCGLGAVAAHAFAKEGAELTLISREINSLENVRYKLDSPLKHRSIALDFGKIREWYPALNEATANSPQTGMVGTMGYFGDLDIVIHCAGGGLGLKGPYIPAQAFYDLFMLNLGGAAELNRLIIPAMQVKGKGTIIHVCSIASGEAVGSVGYNTCKAALGAYVRSLGRELAPFGVVVTGISPGGFRGPFNAMERLQETHPEAYQEFIQKRLPRGKMGEAEELLPLLKFLCSEGASMMGGCLVPVDAGEGHYY